MKHAGNKVQETKVQNEIIKEAQSSFSRNGENKLGANWHTSIHAIWGEQTRTFPQREAEIKETPKLLNEKGIIVQTLDNQSKV